MDYKFVSNTERPLPFWSWNDKISPEVSVKQIREMKEAGHGGFFMHARGGLNTPYMSEEWLVNMDACIKEAKSLGMQAWAYDENGWPSGFASGKINSLGEEYQQKYLKIHSIKDSNDISNILFKNDEFIISYEINPFYTDLLNPKVTDMFIEQVYKVYADYFGDNLTGIFTDEPQLSQYDFPWSSCLIDKYENYYHEDIIPHLIELFKPVGEYKKTRIQYWKLITELFSSNYFKKIYDFCIQQNWQFTGHLLSEESFLGQIMGTGAVMPHYQYFTMPGVDWLGRKMRHELTWHQVSSVAAQMGKSHILTENFAMCGHDLTFDEMRSMYEREAAHGITILCQHLEGYTLAGLRKRDYPPAMGYQQPWRKYYKLFNDTISRTGGLIASGKQCVNVLLIHPQVSAWVEFDLADKEKIKCMNDEFLSQIKQLEEKHIEFHLGDEILMEQYANVENGKIRIGNCSYDTVIIPKQDFLLENTKLLLKQFISQNGKFVNIEELESNNVVDNSNILCTKRILDDEKELYFFVNPTSEIQYAQMNIRGKRILTENGETVSFENCYEFSPFESLLVVRDDLCENNTEFKEELLPLPVDGKWLIEDGVENTVVLDKCDYYFDGELIEKDGYILNIANRANELRRSVKIKCVFRFFITDIPKKLFLACESPKQYRFLLNGMDFTFENNGFLFDEVIHKCDITNLVKIGQNTLVMTTDFVQTNEVYNNISKAYQFETERNKLTFSMEIEPIYLVGDFSVESELLEELENDALRVSHKFTLNALRKSIELKRIEKQGFPFFSGKLFVKKIISLNNDNYYISFPQKSGVNVVEVLVNGNYVGTLLYKYSKLNLSGFLKNGENEIQLIIVNSLRNLFGPHHLQLGESHMIRPLDFYKEKCVFLDKPKDWNDDYCIVRFSLDG